MLVNIRGVKILTSKFLKIQLLQINLILIQNNKKLHYYKKVLKKVFNNII